MAELFKNIYSEESFHLFANEILKVYPRFNKKLFLKDIYSDEWDNLELKQRTRHITKTLNKYLSSNFVKDINIILSLIDQLEHDGIKQESIEFMFLPDFVEVYGLNDYKTSIKAISRITQFTSCEFAVRPFIIKYEALMLKQMQIWAKHPHKKVRRLASEGFRPRLPWGIAIPSFKNNPTPLIKILTHLMGDESETVRRSVANNLNDISKDNPDVVIGIAKSFKGKTKDIDWVIKHASRGLLKKGKPEIMELFGFLGSKNISVFDLEIENKKITVGDSLYFSFLLINKSNQVVKIRLEYAIYYKKANGKLAKKIYKISEKEYKGKSNTKIKRKQSFKLITTRGFYSGEHRLGIIINGKEFCDTSFELI